MSDGNNAGFILPRNRSSHRVSLCLLACLPAPFCVPAPQQDSGHRAAGQGQQPRPQYLQWLWWWRSWTRGNLWPFNWPFTSQHRGDCIFTGFHFLPLKSHSSLFSLAPPQSTIYSPRPLPPLTLWHITHLSALCHFIFLSLPSLFWCLIPSILPFSVPSCLSSSILLALPCSLLLTLVFLCPPSSLHSVPVFTAPPLTPAQFKYRGHFLPISPGARRAPRFAARRKVPVWAVVQWCHSNTNHAVNCFLWGEDRRRDWIETGFPFSSGTSDAVMETDIGMGLRQLMQKCGHIGVLEVLELFGSAASLVVQINYFSTLLWSF